MEGIITVAAEAAVVAYETAPLITLEDIYAAETLENEARLKLYQVSDYSTWYDLNSRIEARRTEVSNRRAELEVVPMPITDFSVEALPADDLDMYRQKIKFTWSPTINASNIKIQMSEYGVGTWSDINTELFNPSFGEATVDLGYIVYPTSYSFKLVVVGGENDGDSNIVSYTPEWYPIGGGGEGGIG